MKRSKLYSSAWRLAPLTFVVGAVACTPMLSGSPDFDIRPVSTQAAADLPGDHGHYQNAVDAIKQRDYGLALSFLQAARAEENDSARVLNAFGVVYDKLGRFDLSARYYEKARTADPQSTIVAGNIAYSHVLQQLLNGDVTPTQLAAATPSAKPPVVTESQTIVAPDVDLKTPRLAMAPVETQSPLSLAAMPLTEFGLGADAGDRPADIKAPQLAIAPIETRTPLSLATLPLTDFDLGTAGDRPADIKAPQLAMAPVETRSVLSLAAMPLTNFDLSVSQDAGDRTVAIERPLQEAAITPPAFHADSILDIAPQLAPVTETQPDSVQPKFSAFAPPPGLLVVASDSTIRSSAPKAAVPQVLADIAARTQLPHASSQQALPSEYFPLFLPEGPFATAPNTEVEKIEDVPQYRAQLAGGFFAVHAEKPLARASLPAPKRVVALNTSPVRQAHPVAEKHAAVTQLTASPVHASAWPVSAQRPVAVRTASVAKTGILTHHPVVIVNASTTRNADDSIRVTLARRNWSIAPLHSTEPHKLTYTTLFYAQMDYPVARALARTLTFPIRLVPDSCHCAGLRLVVGDNAMTRPVGEPSHGTSSGQAGSAVAGVLSSTLQGARGW